MTARNRQPLEELTPREMDVLRLVAQGLSNRRIAEQLAINERTVKYHVSTILAKLEVGNRTEAAMYAIEHGLISI